jgi:hypothetical protein
VERAFTPGRQEASVDQSLEMVTQRGGWEIDVRLYLAGRRTLRPTLHHEAQDLKTHRVTQGTELARMTFQFGGHAYISNLFEV